MIFLGYSFFGDESTVLPTATSINDITYVELADGIYDDLFISKNPDDADENISDIWDFDTILHATFNDTTDAGNVGWNLQNTTNILVKKREASDAKWITIEKHPIETLDDFNFSGVDFYSKAKTNYQYAIVPTLGNIEGNYNVTDVASDFYGIFLAEKDIIYGTELSDDMLNTTRNVPSTTLSLPNHKYAVYCSNSIANYDTGSASGSFVYFDKESCQYDFDHINNQTSKIMEMLTNRKPKLLKSYDGREWLIMVTGNPTDTGDTYIFNRVISFEWAEIGNYKSEKDLYYANLADVPSEWWNT